MTDVKRLLDEATPLPWIVEDPGDNRPVYIDTHAYEDGPEPVVSENYILGEQDARLIVHAVNTLPAYEAAVDALDAFLAGCVFQNLASGLVPQMLEAQQRARAALRAVRGES